MHAVIARLFLGAGITCQIGACCVDDACTTTAQTCCTSAGGAFKGIGTDCRDCTLNTVPDACELSYDPIRACCLPDEFCELRTEACCELDGGLFKPLCEECEDCNCPSV